jgi:hypothetical protein
MEDEKAAKLAFGQPALVRRAISAGAAAGSGRNRHRSKRGYPVKIPGIARSTPRGTCAAKDAID